MVQVIHNVSNYKIETSSKLVVCFWGEPSGHVILLPAALFSKSFTETNMTVLSQAKYYFKNNLVSHNLMLTALIPAFRKTV